MAVNSPIYLDYAATTPIDQQVIETMLGYMGVAGQFGNSGSVAHALGRNAQQAIARAREQVAALVNAQAEEIIWTSGATEAINLALKGAALMYQNRGRHLVTCKTEHKAVLDTCQQLEKQGFSVTYLTPLSSGAIDLTEFTAALRADTVLVSLMHVNNETGVITDLASIASITASRGILLHVDAAQSVGKIPLDVQQIPIDLLSLSAHKIYGPKGVGALYLRRKPRVRVAPFMHGGGQEQGMRAGTLPTHQIVGMGAAYAIAGVRRLEDWRHVSILREEFLHHLQAAGDWHINGDPALCYPGILNISFGARAARDLIAQLPDLALALGSACANATLEPSHVLRAMGLSSTQAESALRFSFGRYTTLTEIQQACIMLNQLLKK